jgi:hypothetical protein
MAVDIKHLPRKRTEARFTSLLRRANTRPSMTENDPKNSKARRYWAMRTSRYTEGHRKVVLAELMEKGILQQGWGYQPDQDLRIVAQLVSKEVWDEINEPQKQAWRHWRMLLDQAPQKFRQDAMKLSDIVPNTPSDGAFTLCQITGAYDYQIPESAGANGDLRRMLKVEVLTGSGGVSNSSELVSSGLHRSLRAQGRLWSLTPHADAIETILKAARDPLKEGQLRGITPIDLADEEVENLFEDPINGALGETFKALRQKICNEGWEHVLKAALEPLVNGTEVIHTGGPAEKGRDLVIQYSNPFNLGMPFLVAVQVKDWTDVVDAGVSKQLKQIIEDAKSRKEGRLIGIVLAITDAGPSPELDEECRRLEHQSGIPITIFWKEDFARLIMRGLIRR